MAKTGIGYDSKAGFKIDTTTSGAYPSTTPAVIGADDLLPLKPGFAVSNDKLPIPSNTVGTREALAHERAGIDFTESLPLHMYYDNSALLDVLASVMGFSEFSNSPNSEGSGAYTHLLQLAGVENVLFKPGEILGSNSTQYRIPTGTLCIDMGSIDTGNVWEYQSCKIESLAISGSGQGADTPIECAVNVRAYNIDRNSQYNEDSGSWTRRCITPVIYKQMDLYIRPQYEFTITSSNDVFVVLENAADTITVDVADGTYSPEKLGRLLADGLNRLTQNSIKYAVEFDYCTTKFTIKNTNNAVTFTSVIASSDMDATLGFVSDPSAALAISGQVGAQYDNADLDSGDLIAKNDFTLTIPNTLFIDRNNTTGDLIDEPVINDQRIPTLETTLTRYKNNDFIEGMERDTRYHGWIVFTGNGIGGDQSYKWQVYIPEMIAMTAPVASGDAGVMNVPITFNIYEPVNQFAPGWEVS